MTVITYIDLLRDHDKGRQYIAVKVDGAVTGHIAGNAIGGYRYRVLGRGKYETESFTTVDLLKRHLEGDQI